MKRDFPDSTFAEIEGMLKKYSTKSEVGRERVYASILKLANSNLELINNLVEKANYDFRDILALAEYPNYTKHAFEDSLPEKTRQQLITDDWNQYKTWFKKI